MDKRADIRYFSDDAALYQNIKGFADGGGCGVELLGQFLFRGEAAGIFAAVDHGLQFFRDFVKFSFHNIFPV